MADYLEKRRQLYYAVLTIPKALQAALGLRFVKSTGEGDRRKAKDIALGYVLGWKILIEQAKGSDTSFLAGAIQFRDGIEKAQDDAYKETLEGVLLDHVGGIAKAQGFSPAKQFYDVAMGVQTPHSLHFDNWKAQLTVTPRTIDRYTKDAQLFIEQFPIIEDVSKKEVSLWLDALSANAVTKDTQKRILKGCRNYWGYISRYNIKGMAEDPFHKVLLADKGKKKPPREVFEPHEIIELWAMARESKAYALADLIALGAYTGARIEELCSLRVENVHDDYFRVIASKTTAGIRDVPIHSHIKSVIKRLKDNAIDGYLLAGVTAGKYKERSGTMSSRFGKLKRQAGYGRYKVFHSLRHTLATALSNANVLEYHIADILGHEKKGVTGSVYSKATNIDVKRVAIEKVSFPFPELT